MPLQIVETERVQKEIGWLEGVDLSFVSLVRHGANREPFKILKSEGDMNDLHIQSILLPKEQGTIDQIKEKLPWLHSAKSETPKVFQTYSEFVQRSKDDFEEVSFVKIPGVEAYAVVGKLKADAVKDGLMVPGDWECPWETTLTASEVAPVPVNDTAADIFYDELDGFMSTVRGIMSQTGYDAQTRKDTVLSAYNALGAFLNMWLDAVGTASTAMKADKCKPKPKPKEEESMTPEEITTLLDEKLTAQKADLDTRFDALNAAITEIKESIPKTEEPPPAEDPAVTVLKTELEELKAKYAELEAKGHEEVTDPKGKGDVPDDESVEKGEKSVFAGLLFRKA